MNRSSLSPILLAAALAAAAGTGEAASRKAAAPAREEAAKPATNDFPTLARVEYVLQCMNDHGGQNYNNLYHCVCAADKIAAALPYQDYSEALTFTYLFDLPGEKGALFRDPPKSKDLRDRFKAAKKDAEGCFPPKPAPAAEAAPPAAPSGDASPAAPPATDAPAPSAPAAAPSAPFSGRGRPENPRQY
jgi:hypothetical protein